LIWFDEAENRWRLLGVSSNQFLHAKAAHEISSNQNNYAIGSGGAGWQETQVNPINCTSAANVTGLEAPIASITAVVLKSIRTRLLMWLTGLF
jgi:hypothetical protein